MHRAFELYVLRQLDWEIDAVFDDRATALAAAHRLRLTLPSLTVRIVDETFDEASGETTSHIIFQAAGTGQEGPNAGAPKRYRPPSEPEGRPATPAAAAVAAQTSVTATVMLRVLGLGATAFFLLTVLFYLPKVLH